MLAVYIGEILWQLICVCVCVCVYVCVCVCIHIRKQ